MPVAHRAAALNSFSSPCAKAVLHLALAPHFARKTPILGIGGTSDSATMHSPELVAGIMSAIATAAWAVCIRGASFETFAAAFLLVGACGGMRLLLQESVGVDWPHAVTMAIVLVGYQSVLLVAFRTGLPTIQAIVNANVLFIVLIDALTGTAAFNTRVFAVCCAHALLGYYIVTMKAPALDFAA